MLSILRILLTGALLYGLMQAAKNAGANPQTGDLMNAFWLGYCVIVGIFAAITWAPLVGNRMADPVSGILTNSTYVERPNGLLKLIRRIEGRRCRPLVRWLCFVEGVRHPWLPAQFIIGLNHAAPGSWLELAFAREVYRFNNLQNCVQAFGVLRRRGHMPPPHANTEVTLVLMSLEKAAKPVTPVLPVPNSAPPSLKRNLRIKLSEQEQAPPSPSSLSPPSGAPQNTPPESSPGRP
jgi:hypothetical protein